MAVHVQRETRDMNFCRLQQARCLTNYFFGIKYPVSWCMFWKSLGVRELNNEMNEAYSVLKNNDHHCQWKKYGSGVSSYLCFFLIEFGVVDLENSKLLNMVSLD